VTLMPEPECKAVYIVYHYDGTELIRLDRIEFAVYAVEYDRELEELGRHCVVKDGRIVYWSKRTDNADRRTVREDFVRFGIITNAVDAIEGPDDIREQHATISSPADKVFDGSKIEEEAIALLSGSEDCEVLVFEIATAKHGVDKITVSRERGPTLPYSYALGDGAKVFTETQLKAMKLALKRFRDRVKVEMIDDGGCQ